MERENREEELRKLGNWKAHFQASPSGEFCNLPSILFSLIIIDNPGMCILTSTLSLMYTSSRLPSTSLESCGSASVERPKQILLCMFITPRTGFSRGTICISVHAPYVLKRMHQSQTLSVSDFTAFRGTCCPAGGGGSQFWKTGGKKTTT